MTAFKGTPGPWHVSHDERGFAIAQGKDNSHNGTAPFVMSDWGHRNKRKHLSAPMGGEDIAKANARLIAAAPALLEALQFALTHLEHRPGLSHRLDLFTQDERNYLRAAIAQAIGE